MATKNALQIEAPAEDVNADVKHFGATESDKGGAGKSIINRVHGEVLRLRGIKTHLYDGDAGTQTLLTQLGTRDEKGRIAPKQEASEGVDFYDITDVNQRTRFLDSTEDDARVILHDHPGGAYAALARIIDSGDRDAQNNMDLSGIADVLRSAPVSPFFFHALTHEEPSTASVNRYIKAFEGPHFRHVVFINKQWGKLPGNFPFWFGFRDHEGNTVGGKTRERLLASGGIELWWPVLQSECAAKVSFYKIPFHQAGNDKRLSVTERGQAKKFWEEASAVVDESLKYLGL
ncbi:hypothetical protein BB934_45765 (plasmid) [Microvirga ossetica]|uniref:Uncharacterized protein n=1 Tax=Microvirga ossetica TaxID=1882682 RepID=A0A1B2EZV6_9HYPH|nr:hypothetical protein [Microvirga ossetica]ANY85529.1 hypothetical protein BB934_45765 [Microvirga ossetica]